MARRTATNGTPADPITRGGLRHQVEGRLLTAVFQADFRPGERLVVQRISELYGVSPTPVREALVVLAALGVVHLSPNRGAVVLPFGAQQVCEIGQVRRVLEVEATRCACGRTDPAELAEVRGAIAGLLKRAPGAARDRDARRCATRPHGLIAGSCGSARLTDEIDRYLTLFRALRDVTHRRDAVTNYARTDDIAEHLEILDRLSEGDARMAALSMD